MKRFHNSPFETQLEIVASFRDREIAASLNELRKRDETTIALRTMLRNGVSIDELSDASGLTPAEIRRRVDRGLVFGEDMDSLTGAR
jgi:uncharacterized protein YerC